MSLADPTKKFTIYVDGYGVRTIQSIERFNDGSKIRFMLWETRFWTAGGVYVKNGLTKRKSNKKMSEITNMVNGLHRHALSRRKNVRYGVEDAAQ